MITATMQMTMRGMATPIPIETLAMDEVDAVYIYNNYVSIACVYPICIFQVHSNVHVIEIII